jgi:RNA polymerase sigma factor (sigma-70 family)
MKVVDNSLYEKYDRLIRFLITQASPPSRLDREDLSQDVWVKALADPDKLSPAYLGSIVQTVIADAVGESPRTAELYDVAEESDEEFIMPDFAEKAMLDLTPADRTLLTLRYINGMTYDALARRYRCSIERINTRLRTARRRAKSLGGK